ncbi:hypothetical protein LJC34_05815 [Oscillospiraceae bacterium OttesenSCG-928-G22]|nr:hypothetical protein [Oscillospiraceae bacterium OttesenSCG-928-G22]
MNWKKKLMVLALVAAIMVSWFVIPAGAADLETYVTFSDHSIKRMVNGVETDLPDPIAFANYGVYRMSVKWKLDLPADKTLQAGDTFTIPLSFGEGVTISMPGGNTANFNSGDGNKAGELSIDLAGAPKTEYKITVKFTDVTYFNTNPNNITGTAALTFTYVVNSHSGGDITWNFAGEAWTGGTTRPEDPTKEAKHGNLVAAWKRGWIRKADALRAYDLGDFSFILNEDLKANYLPEDTMTVTDNMSAQNLTTLRKPWDYTDSVSIDTAKGIYGQNLADTSGDGYFKFYFVDYDAAYTLAHTNSAHETKYKNKLGEGKVHYAIQSFVCQLAQYYPLDQPRTIWAVPNITDADIETVLTPVTPADGLLLDITHTTNSFTITLKPEKLNGKRLLCVYNTTFTEVLESYTNEITVTANGNDSKLTPITLANGTISGSVVGTPNSLTIKKVDAKEPTLLLPNVEFKLTKEGVPESTFVRNLTTKDTGPDLGTVTTLFGVVAASDVFILEEVKGPDGYNALPSKLKFKVDPATFEITPLEPQSADWFSVAHSAGTNSSTITITNSKPSGNTGGGTPTPKPSPSVSPSVSPSASPSTDPSTSPSDTPTTNPSTNPTTGPSTNPSAGPGATLVPTEDGYEVIDENGVPIGKWTLDEDTGEWIYDEYPPTGTLPDAGGLSPFAFVFLLGFATFGAGALLGFGSGKGRRVKR